MGEEKNTGFGLSSSTLKLLACVFMAVDHVGVRLFPTLWVLRAIGRLAFPIFAFFIAEGCRYTRNKTRHFFTLLLFGVAFMAVYFVYDGRVYGNIFLTFSMSTLLVYLLQWCKKQYFSKKRVGERILAVVWLIAGVLVAYGVTLFFHLEYGFLGVILPLLISIPVLDDVKTAVPLLQNKSTQFILQLAFFTVGLLLLCINANLGVLQFFSLLTVPLLALYNGKVGARKMKYFFYIFYPVHLLIIEGIALLIR